MKSTKISFLIVLLFFLVVVKAQSIYQPVKELAQRRIPWLSEKISFSSIPKESGKDVFILQTKNNRLELSASSTSAATKGLGYYLKNYCHRSMSHMGDNLSAVDQLPVIKEPLKIISNADIRFALNYCTINYTMSFYGWKEWEHELDWMALNGVNLVLAPIGVEAVWQNTLQKLGYNEKEILQFIAGPAFSAWWLMGNLQGWGGPITQGIINQQSDLEKKILARMKIFGMQPVMQGFYGMVPNTLKDKGIDILEQGQWAGGFQRPAFLKPDDNFKKIAALYYDEMKKLYGSDLHYFSGDPFHEGGKSGDINVADYGRLVQTEMQNHFSGSTWVLMGWQINPSSKILSKLDKSKVLVQELFGENTANWSSRKGYEGTPFIWCTVTNFGDKNGMYGKLQRFANEVYRANNSEYASLMKGVGIMPEGIHNNPVVYDLVLDLAWHSEKVETSDWIKSFVDARYGKSNKKIQQAWEIFLQTIYISFNKSLEGPPESVFCARPSLKVASVSSWGTRERNYDVVKFKEGVKLFVDASDEMNNSATYQIDKIDFVRQVLANTGEKVYQDMVTAFEQKNINQFSKQSNLFLSMIKMQDSLLSCNEHFQVYSWLKQANDFGKTSIEKSIAVKNAKMQITYWGPDNSDTNLHEYANKEWSGLMGHFYLPRWELFVTRSIAELKGDTSASIPDYFAFEQNWCNKPDMYPPLKISKTKQSQIIKEILK
ncbi:alpha-N-acetylglucosaminidase [Flavobacterium gilvum]|uniref:Alpha-N-acetylglucosaminidase n=1 Tax=Flavobacterium gilvum TaxID=1492737 RepID=A0AAC9I658_9FLAO|nr:alpha-N-acetylglucosaminidase [Flavobacterium gilvum]AOW11179.1 alpha-N-acetylglucosaminidase [Flavobacterium gilvum]KFC58712.1 Alpha-N-acetylglucosaminidase, Alpha-L-fucosidase [Flavobacterium gilvum]